MEEITEDNIVWKLISNTPFANYIVRIYTAQVNEVSCKLEMQIKKAAGGVWAEKRHYYCSFSTKSHSTIAGLLGETNQIIRTKC